MTTLPSTSLDPRVTPPAAPLCATAVIVLYRMTPGQSPAFRSLIEARAEISAREANVCVVLWDNSPSRPSILALPEDVDVLSRPAKSRPGNCLQSCARNRASAPIALAHYARSGLDASIRLLDSAGGLFPPPRWPSGYRRNRSANRVGRKRLSPNRFVLGRFLMVPPGFRGAPDEPVFAMTPAPCFESTPSSKLAATICVSARS